MFIICSLFALFMAVAFASMVLSVEMYHLQKGHDTYEWVRKINDKMLGFGFWSKIRW